MRKLYSLLIALMVTVVANAQFAGGKGTAEDPYLIADAYQLADMCNIGSSINNHFKLSNSIDLKEWIEENSPNLGWNPIGNKDNPFCGYFDGAGYTIYGLSINRPNQKYIGLFGYVSGGKISNLNIETPIVIGGDYSAIICGIYDGHYLQDTFFSNCSILNGGELSGGNYTGGVCGKTYGGILGCESNITKIQSNGDNVGGIVGWSNSPINSCKVEMELLESTYKESKIGGIIGYAYPYSHIDHNIVIISNILGGKYIGGIVGSFESKVEDSSNYIKNCITIANRIQSNNQSYSAGICGYSYLGAQKATMNIDNCYSYCNLLSSEHWTGGIVACTTNNASSTTNITNCLTDGTLIGSDNTSGIGRSEYNCNTSKTLVLCNSIISSNIACGIVIGKCSNSVCLARAIEGYRVNRVSSSDSKNNKALSTIKLIENGILLEDVPDNNLNGTGFGDQTMKRATTYSGIGWDMNNDWKINEGVDYPSLRLLSDYPIISKYETTSNCRLYGNSPVNGKIYVMKDGATYTSDIIDNAFEINVGAVNVGDTLLYFSMPEGGKPSMVRRIVIEGTTDPSCDVVKGDANGDSVVDAADVVSTVNSILGKPSSTFVQKNADVNEDGLILVDDAVGTVNVIMNNQ